jgi:Flp pilus assembly protein CpaB
LTPSGDLFYDIARRRPVGGAGVATAEARNQHTTRQRARRRPTLPSTRALTGAALIVAASAGVLVAHRSASQPPTTRYVVVTHDVPAGHRLTRADLGTLAADLPSGVTAVESADADRVLGRVTRASLSEMDLVRSGDVLEAGRFTTPGSVEVPVEVDAGRSLGDALRPGSRVDVLSTDPEAAGTATLATDVLVVAVDGESADGIGGSGARRVRLSAPDATTASAIVDAAVRAQLTLVLPTPLEGPTGG